MKVKKRLPWDDNRRNEQNNKKVKDQNVVNKIIVLHPKNPGHPNRIDSD